VKSKYLKIKLLDSLLEKARIVKADKKGDLKKGII
jgi:hypothetical protein